MTPEADALALVKQTPKQDQSVCEANQSKNLKTTTEKNVERGLAATPQLLARIHGRRQ
jgi:hypothetical protein